jgi:uncharacterized protein
VAAETVPPDLPAVVERHGRVVAAGDQQAILGDFRDDRIGQLVASASLPDDLVASELLSLEPQDDGLYAAHIRYTAADGRETVLRSRWIHLPEGWRVTQVRNVPPTPPRLAAEGPAGDGLDTPHWEGLRAGELRLQRCSGCSSWIWAPRPMCPSCHGMDFDWPAVEPVGTVFSWTRTWQPFAPEVSGHLPYLVLLVELPDAGRRRVLGVAAGGDVEDGGGVAIGRQVKGEIEAPSDEGRWPLVRWRLT